MSRIGKKPIPVPAGVTATVQGDELSVKGPKGVLAMKMLEDIEFTLEPDAITVKPKSDTKRARSVWFSRRSRSVSVARATRWSSRSASNGFSMKSAAPLRIAATAVSILP